LKGAESRWGIVSTHNFCEDMCLSFLWHPQHIILFSCMMR